jgi:mannose-6-phosphate isomerase
VERLPDVLPMRPYFREMVWGGRRLQELYGKELPEGKAIGEAFEVSAYPGRESAVAAGPLAGWGLHRLVEVGGEQLLGQGIGSECGGRFPLLIKLLDARQDLSIQVHPDDRYAREKRLEDSGKTEAWFVLQSDGGQVAHGLKDGVGRTEFVEAVGAGRTEEVIRFFQVRPGDMVFMPPGTVHALCRGVVIYEVQQASDLTFRIHDYHRLGLDGRPRQLHVQEALEVIDFAARLPGPVPWRALPEARADRAALVRSGPFRLNYYRPAAGRARHGAAESCLALTLVSGAARVGGARDECRLRAGATALIPAGREFAVEPDGPDCSYLVASAGTVVPDPA